MNLFCLLILSLLGCGDKTVEDSVVMTLDDTGSSNVGVPVADCSVELTGVSWGQPAVSDHNPSFEATLDAIDFEALPEQFDISELLGIYRGSIAYALEIAPSQLGGTIDRDDAIATGWLGKVVVASLVTEDLAGIDYMFFRQGLQRYYTCSRGFPMTIDGFEATYGEIAAEYTDVDSAAKCATRRLRINPAAGVYVAESLWDGEVRETEILLDGHRSDGQLDFIVYGADGVLTDRSQFPTLGGGEHLVTSAPYTCMTCHLNSSADADTWGYDTLFPTGTGPCAE